MISTDKALDILPVLGNIIDKLEIKDLSKNAGLTIFRSILGKTKDIKPELFEIVKIVDETKTDEEIKSQSIGKTIKVLKEITDDEDLMTFIKQAFK